MHIRTMGIMFATLAVTTVTAMAQAFSASAQYLVIDLSGGPDAAKYPVQYVNEPPDVDFDSCRTKEIWLRLIPAGTFMMGSPASELGRGNDEDYHQVTLTKPFYIGVFEVTQRQYELVMGKNPSEFKGSMRPVTSLSYNMLRGSSAGAQWPANNDVDASSFFGVLRAKTALLADLPTEAQWEYACRAGTTTALNSRKNITDKTQCPNVAEVARYKHNRDDGKGNYTERTTKVGMYLPNAWGLYDMHGNAWEFCLDWYTERFGTDPVTDPKGPASGSKRAQRGGGCNNTDDAWRSRSSIRSSFATPSTEGDHSSFRVVVLPKSGQTVAQAKPPTPPPPSPVAPSDVFRTPTDKGADKEKPKGMAVKVAFRIDTKRGTLQETGSSSRARPGDEIAISAISETDSKLQPNSTWVIESAEMTEGPIRQARTDRGHSRLPPLATDGNFVLVYYTVENTTQHSDFYSSMPVLVDTKDRRFLPVGDPSEDKMPSYVPDGRLWFSRDKIAPGFTKPFCVIFEIPPNSTPKHVEIYPAGVAKGFTDAIRQGKAKGKAVDLTTALGK